VKDAEFKELAHPVGVGKITSRGNNVSPGYKPDVTVCDASGRLVFILESEQKTDRKAFLGSLVKAEMFAEAQAATPELVIVMKSFQNTTTRQIADHLRPYKNWLAGMKGGALRLAAIQVLSEADYLEAIEAGDELGSAGFKSRGHVV